MEPFARHLAYIAATASSAYFIAQFARATGYRLGRCDGMAAGRDAGYAEASRDLERDNTTAVVMAYLRGGRDIALRMKRPPESDDDD